ncbi:MAG: hypothetical protein WD100_12185 [Tistlia sp.]|uniref:hypothetical protein n=1 Tax=Tistlia sp. TaxID=3057121 RepID=UPI0034A33F68
MTDFRLVPGLAGAVALWLLLAPAAAPGADPQDADWPCIQRKVPEISAAVVWAGPPIDQALSEWREDEEVERLVGELAARSLPLETAQEKAEAFTQTLDGERNARLTRLFAGLLQTVNRERGAIMAGIERYTRRQRELAERIEATGSRLDGLPAEAGARREELAQQQAWDIRIYQEREQSLKYLCQQPIDLEQRLFLLARTIAGGLA